MYYLFFSSPLTSQNVQDRKKICLCTTDGRESSCEEEVILVDNLNNAVRYGKQYKSLYDQFGCVSTNDT